MKGKNIGLDLNGQHILLLLNNLTHQEQSSGNETQQYETCTI